MTDNGASNQEIEPPYQDYVESPEYRKQLEQWYQKEKVLRLIIIGICLVFLGISSFGQFAILDYSFGERLALADSDKIFGVPIKVLLSLLVTAALPVTTLIDESGILGERIKISLLGIKFSPILWIVLPGDVLLTVQAVLVGNQDAKNPDPFLPAIGFVLAAIFSTSAFYLSKGIVAAFSKYMSACKNLQIIKIYGINPIPLYKDAEQIKLTEEYEAAVKEAEQTKQELQKIRAEKQNLETQNIQDQEQLRQLQYLEAEQVQKIQDFEQKIQELEQQLTAYKSYADELSQLKSNFTKVSKPIKTLISQGKKMFEEFSGLDESANSLKFPSLTVSSTANGDGKVAEKPTFYWRWPNSNGSWQDLQLPSELSPVAVSLLNALSTMVQQQELPVPNNIRNYAPRQELAKCLIIDFESYRVLVYCRDEEYRKDGTKWDAQTESNFEGKLVDDQLNGYCTLEFTAQEIMSNQVGVLEKIKDAINSKMGGESN